MAEKREVDLGKCFAIAELVVLIPRFDGAYLHALARRMAERLKAKTAMEDSAVAAQVDVKG